MSAVPPTVLIPLSLPEVNSVVTALNGQANMSATLAQKILGTAEAQLVPTAPPAGAASAPATPAATEAPAAS